MSSTEPSEIIACQMRKLARQEAPAREAREWRRLYALQDAQKRLGGGRHDMRMSEQQGRASEGNKHG